VSVQADVLPDDPGLLKAMLIAERMESDRPRQIWQSTASFAAVTSPSGSRMSPPAATRRIAQRFDKGKLGGQSDLN
jgi:hypothetical protein